MQHFLSQKESLPINTALKNIRNQQEVYKCEGLAELLAVMLAIM